MRYLVKRRVCGNDIYFWIPKKQYCINGKFVNCPLKCQRLYGELSEIFAKATELNGQLNEWKNGTDQKLHITYGSVDWLICEYKKDERFKNLRESTQRLYLFSIEEMRKIFTAIPVDKVTRLDAKAFYRKFAHTKRKASQVMQVARVIFNLAKDLDLIKENPFERQRIVKPDPRQIYWPIELIKTAQERAIQMGLPSISLAIQLGLDTAQRPGDLRNLTWNNYTGHSIKLRQSKTRVWVEIPVMKELKALLDKADKKSPSILVYEETGKPYTKDMLSRKIREVCLAAGIGNEYQFRDLRRTAVVRLAENGCNLQEICSITGHSIHEANDIMKVYLPMTSKMAENAINKIEKLKQR